MKGYMYILECGNGAYYIGSTDDLKLRVRLHQDGKAANFSAKHPPVKLVYYEEFKRLDEAFNREQNVKGWSRAKKQALIYGQEQLLHGLSACKNNSHYKNRNLHTGTTEPREDEIN
jgi:putative endonuclease